LVKELQFLVGGRVDNIYNPEKEEFILQLHVSGKGKQILRMISGKLFYLASWKKPAEAPSGFCMFLRKHLGGARLRGINQLESERIVELLFEKKDGKERLVVELFGKGNILLCDENNIVLSALVYHKWKDREIRAKFDYSYPKREYNLFDIKLDELTLLFNKSDKNVVKCLASDLGLGGSYAEEVCLISDVDKDKKAIDADEKEIKAIFKVLGNIIETKIKPLIVYDKDEVKDIVPFNLKVYDKLKVKEFKGYSEAFDDYFLVEFKEEKPKSKQEKEIERIKRMFETQKKQIDGLGVKEEKEREKAELIYNNYKLLGDILSELKKAAEKHSWDEIKERLKGHKVIKSVNSKEKTIEVEF
jgi:predicted ribosome quality control (RQC) complex YloA/Tae2 family protein